MSLGTILSIIILYNRYNNIVVPRLRNDTKPYFFSLIKINSILYAQ